MIRPLFADPKTDFVFKRLFRTEEHKPLLIALLNDVIGVSICDFSIWPHTEELGGG